MFYAYFAVDIMLLIKQLFSMAMAHSLRVDRKKTRGIFVLFVFRWKWLNDLWHQAGYGELTMTGPYLYAGKELKCGTNI